MGKDVCRVNKRLGRSQPEYVGFRFAPEPPGRRVLATFVSLGGLGNLTMSLKRKVAYAMCFAGLVACGQWEAKPAGQASSDPSGGGSPVNVQIQGVWVAAVCETPTGGGDTTQTQLSFANGSVQVTAFHYTDLPNCKANTSFGQTNEGTYAYVVEDLIAQPDIYRVRYINTKGGNTSTYGVVQLSDSISFFSPVPGTSTAQLPSTTAKRGYMKK